MGGGGSKNTVPAIRDQLVGMKGDGGEPLTLGTAAFHLSREWDTEFQNALQLLDSNEMLKGCVSCLQIPFKSPDSFLNQSLDHILGGTGCPQTSLYDFAAPRLLHSIGVMQSMSTVSVGGIHARSLISSQVDLNLLSNQTSAGPNLPRLTCAERSPCSYFVVCA